MLVSLPPRNIREVLEAFHILSPPNPQKFRDICSQMETELGSVLVDRDVGELGALVAKFRAILDQNEEASFQIKAGKEQEYANLYRELDNRILKLEDQEKELRLYSGRGEKTDTSIKDTKDKLATKMHDIRKTRDELEYYFDDLEFGSYNRIFQKSFNFFIYSPINTVCYLLKTTKAETVALTAFALIASYSLYTNTDSSYLIKILPYLGCGYIGYIFSKILRSEPKDPEPQQITFTVSSPTKR